MKRPTAVELRKYATKIGYRDFDPVEFLAYYNANGWYVGRVRMKSWEATVVYWKRRSRRRQGQPVRMPYNKRQETINHLNRRKAQLMREPQTLRVRQELEQIRMKLMEL